MSTDDTDSVLMRNAVPLKIVPIGSPYIDLEADKVLQAALGQLDCVVIAGKGKDGKEYFASSMADGGDTIWYLERCKLKLLTTPDADQDED